MRLTAKSSLSALLMVMRLSSPGLFSVARISANGAWRQGEFGAGCRNEKGKSMGLDKQLPGPIARFLKSGFTAEYATVSAAGMPVDTPVLYFPSPGLASIDLATGLSYPAKAERARRNPKVGLLIEGGPHEPVISIAGMAAVRDADLQANVLRYVSEASQALPHNPSWKLAQKAVWYWTRMLVAVAPVRIDWWDNSAALDGPPQSWQAPHGTLFPQSDPAPPGQTSTPAAWRHPPWRELAAEAQARGDKPYLSVIDADGFPRPIGVNSANVTSNGFQLELPRCVPWTIAGNACLTFRGIETFLGEIEGDMLRVERTLPVFPMTTDMTQLWEPTPDTRAQLMARLEHELERRGQPVPAIPAERPPPTEYYNLRLARLQGIASPAGQKYDAPAG